MGRSYSKLVTEADIEEPNSQEQEQQNAYGRASNGTDDPEPPPGDTADFARAAKDKKDKDKAGDSGAGAPKIRSFTDIPLISSFSSRKIEYVIGGVLPAGAIVALTGDSGSGKSTLAWARQTQFDGFIEPSFCSV
jgi:ABC-type glutathione transport system ATPase component